MLTAAVRDLHAAAPGQFRTDVRTSAPGLWEHNPYLCSLREGEPGVEVLDMHYPLIHQSNQRPYHFLHGYVQYLEQKLGLRIPLTRFQGDIHLAAAERDFDGFKPLDIPEKFWIVMAGGKYDFTAKWWAPDHFQKVVDHFRDRLTFVQCGEAGHWHPRLQGVVDLVGKTSLREFVRLMHHAEGVVCPVTFAMHLAAAVPCRPGKRTCRPCVVVAGGREPAHWEAYPQHQFLSTAGVLPCCTDGGCWRSRCQIVGDGDDKDRRNLCENPVQISADLRIPLCMNLITPDDVIRRVEIYIEGATLFPQITTCPPATMTTVSKHRSPNGLPGTQVKPDARTILIEFRHGLGDAVQLTVILKHLKHYQPSWNIDVAALVGKHSLYHSLCRRVLVLDRDRFDRSNYDQIIKLDWHEHRSNQGGWPSTKPTRCLAEVFRLTPIPELCSYSIQVGPQAREKARCYLEEVCQALPWRGERFPAVLLHYQGNTSSEQKDLSHHLARDTCEAILRGGAVPVILDWDNRTPLCDGKRIHNPGADHPLWGVTGTGDGETLAALIEQSALMIGVDSGPLHVAGTTTTPTIGVWTRHHPAHFFDLADNVTHLVPVDHEQSAAGPAVLDYFACHYRYRVYRQLHVELPALVESQLTGADLECLTNKRFLKQLRATGYGEEYYQEHRLAGLDYLACGDWQRQYGRWLVESLDWRNKRILDVGCACGAILRGLSEMGAMPKGVELNEAMIRRGREAWPDLAPLLFVCDAVNLHLFPDASCDGIHTAQVAEHWKPELVPHILRELSRVTVPGGLFFCSLDTEELFVRQGRKMEDEDPTHVCIRPLAWWHQQLRGTGWHVCSAEFERPLREHPESFLKRYDWDWFVARKRE